VATTRTAPNATTPRSARRNVGEESGGMRRDVRARQRRAQDLAHGAAVAAPRQS
jgi:hypothetical protein